MGSDVLPFLTSPSLLNPLSSPLGHRIPLKNPTSTFTHCFSTSPGGRRGAGARWHSNSKRPKDYEGFSWDDEITANDEFGFGGSTKHRIWWSGDPSPSPLGNEYDVEDEEAGIDGFGSVEGSIGFAWVMKVLRPFAWMLPAIIMSAVLGTDTNTIIMALALPLAQSALSLVMDAIWGWSDEGPRSKYKKKRRRYARAVSNPGIRMGKGENTRNGKGVGDYQSSSGAPDRKKSRSTLNFGGWDELDNDEMEGKQEKPLNQRPAEPKQWSDGKLSKRIGRRENPFLLRLLIAVFPFLGSWTKLL